MLRDGQGLGRLQFCSALMESFLGGSFLPVNIQMYKMEGSVPPSQDIK